MQKRNVLSALCAAFALCAASALAAMPDAEFVKLCAEGTVAQVKQALKNGANPNARAVPGGDESDTTALMEATNSGDVGKVKVLLSAGADVNARDKEGMTALMRMLTSALTTAGAPDVAEALISAGTNVNATDNDGVTPLMLAAWRGNGEMGSLLLSSGADKGLKDKDGHDALWYARNPMFVPCEECMADFVRRLEGGGAKKPAAQDAGAFSAADLKRMSTFVSNFVEVRFPDFDMKQSGDAGTLHLGGDPSHPMLMYFGIWHNYTNNYKSRVKPCSGEGCKHGNSVMDAKFVAESVKKYFDIELKHRSAPDADDSPRFHFDGRLYHFEAADGELASEAKVTRAVREGDIIRMTGDIYLEDDPNNAVGSFIATAKPHKWNGKDTWAILSLKTEYR